MAEESLTRPGSLQHSLHTNSVFLIQQSCIIVT